MEDKFERLGLMRIISTSIFFGHLFLYIENFRGFVRLRLNWAWFPREIFDCTPEYFPTHRSKHRKASVRRIIRALTTCPSPPSTNSPQHCGFCKVRSGSLNNGAMFSENMLHVAYVINGHGILVVACFLVIPTVHWEKFADGKHG